MMPFAANDVAFAVVLGAALGVGDVPGGVGRAALGRPESRAAHRALHPRCHRSARARPARRAGIDAAQLWRAVAAAARADGRRLRVDRAPPAAGGMDDGCRGLPRSPARLGGGRAWRSAGIARRRARARSAAAPATLVAPSAAVRGRRRVRLRLRSSPTRRARAWRGSRRSCRPCSSSSPCASRPAKASSTRCAA